jgi:hypothetical protein
MMMMFATVWYDFFFPTYAKKHKFNLGWVGKGW